MLKLREYKIIYGSKTIEYGNISVSENEFIGIYGSSGCGKTSLLDSIFSPSFKGTVSYSEATLFNKDLSRIGIEKYKHASYCPQFSQDALNPKLTVSEHIQLTLRGNKLSSDDAEINHMLSELSLENNILDSYPFMLSGGQKQRVVILLSVIKKPKMIVLDEPSSALDLITMKTIVNFLYKVRKNKTIIMVSHNRGMLNKLCEKIIEL